MMSLWDALRMNMMISYQELVRTFLRGVIAVKGNEQVKIGSYTIPIIDTTGAGDTFNGAFVYSLIKNMPLIEALKFASATAAINITALGARGHLATPSEVNLFLSQHD